MWLMHKGRGHPWGDSPELAGDEGVWLGASSTSNTRTAWGATETAPRTPPEALAGPIWSGAGESVSGKARVHQHGLEGFTKWGAGPLRVAFVCSQGLPCTHPASHPARCKGERGWVCSSCHQHLPPQHHHRSPWLPGTRAWLGKEKAP